MTKSEERERLLEREGRFDEDIIPYRTDNVQTIDEGYSFCFSRTEKFFRSILVGAVYLVLRPLLFFSCGFCIRGKEKIKGLGGIVVTNHAHVFDCLMVQPLRSYFRVYHTGAGFNAKRDIRGKILKLLGFLPLNGSFGAQKNLKKRIGEIVQTGGLVQFYPEHALWHGYKKPRPLKNGAFRYAAIFSVPVLPTFITFEKGRFRKRRAVLNVLDPLYPKAELSQRENADFLREKCFSAWRELYEKTYGVPLVYEKKNISC